VLCLLSCTFAVSTSSLVLRSRLQQRNAGQLLLVAMNKNYSAAVVTFSERIQYWVSLVMM
jgi:hypothetical protein